MTCKFPCRVSCTRNATEIIDSMNDTPVCHGHGRLGRWNILTWEYSEFDDLTDLSNEYLSIKKWFKENPRP